MSPLLSGLKGAVVFSLAVRDTSTDVGCTILATTLLLVGLTIWVLGTAADPVLRRLDIRVKVDAYENPKDLSFEVAAGRPDTTRGLWHHLDYKSKASADTPWPSLTDSLPQWRGVFARLVREEEEQLCEAEPDDSTLDLEKTDLVSIGGHSGSDLLEGDLGLCTAAAPHRTGLKLQELLLTPVYQPTLPRG